MSLPEILSQISTVIAAGHETTSSALTWTLYALARNPESQRKLREAFYTLSPSSSPSPSSPFSPSFSPSTQNPASPTSTHPPTDHALQTLPYLDHVVRESLRLHAPITSTMRIATHTDLIPLSTPFLDHNGVLQNFVRVEKGDMINIPIQAINKFGELWGEDAGEFRWVVGFLRFVVLID
jgi:cytochrome P450